MTNKQRKVIEFIKEKLSQREEEIRKGCPSYYEKYKEQSLEDKILDLGGEQIGLAIEKAGYNVNTQMNVVKGTQSGQEWVDRIIELMEKC